MKHRIVILVTWFGKWPFWIDFFIESCKWNKEIHWKFITDSGKLSNQPENIELIQMSFSEFSVFVGKRLKINFNPDDAYKFCDIKPMLGYLFESYIKEYTFWGFGDLDLIYGNMRGYYTDKMLDKYDLISTHVTRVSGHLCLLRNNKKMRNIFRHVHGWQEIIVSSQHKIFDEKHFSKLFIQHKNWPYFIRRLMDQFSYTKRRAFFKEAFTTPNMRLKWTDGTRNFPEKWFCTSRGLTNDRDKKKQFPYIHFMHWKGDIWDYLPDKKSLIDVDKENIEKGWILSEDGFHSLPDMIGNGE